MKCYRRRREHGMKNSTAKKTLRIGILTVVAYGILIYLPC
jgi:hypothetical protein